VQLHGHHQEKFWAVSVLVQNRAGPSFEAKCEIQVKWPCNMGLILLEGAQEASTDDLDGPPQGGFQLGF
jgi:hypothetical protein